MNEKQTRTESDPHHAQVKLDCMRRHYFCRLTAWQWVIRNRQDIAAAITDEARKRWPTKTKYKIKGDLSFLEGK
jgi:hypothetical protein